jgi:hypothetical protein
MPPRHDDEIGPLPTTRAERARLRLVSEFLIWLLTSRLPERAA